MAQLTGSNCLEEQNRIDICCFFLLSQMWALAMQVLAALIALLFQSLQAYISMF
jgi:hypothetical protein